MSLKHISDTIIDYILSNLENISKIITIIISLGGIAHKIYEFKKKKKLLKQKPKK